MKIIKVGLPLVILSGIVFVLCVDYKTESAIHRQLDNALSQKLQYQSMNSTFFGDEITFDDAVLSDISVSDVDDFNFKADKVTLDVDYSNALLKNFQVKGIEADGVTLVFDYQGVGDSNIHAIQQNLRQFIAERRKAKKRSVDWDVYTIMLRDVKIELSDAGLGEIGTFHVDSITIPHVSSKFSGKNNKDIFFAAVAKELSRQFMDDKIRGDYDRKRFIGFLARETRSEMGELFRESAQKLGNKARRLFQSFRRPPVQQPNTAKEPE